MSIESVGELPLNLVMVRHGQSTRNAAATAFHKHGVPLPEWYFDDHDSFATLTDKGEEQAAASGKYLMQEFPEGFDRFITSDLPRTLQTAVKLAISGAAWETRDFWRERDWGEHNFFADEIPSEYGMSQRLKSQNPYQWRPAGGESFATDVALRFGFEEIELRSNPPARNVLVVSHGDQISGALKHFEGLTIAEWNARHRAKERLIANTMFVHLTRVVDGQITPHYQRLRGVCPWDTSRSWQEGEWISIRPPQKYSNEDLADLIARSLPSTC